MTSMSTNTHQLEKLVVQSAVSRVMARRGISTEHISDITITTDRNGELQFDVVLNVPIDAFSMRMTGSQARKPELVMCHDDDL